MTRFSEQSASSSRMTMVHRAVNSRCRVKTNQWFMRESIHVGGKSAS